MPFYLLNALVSNFIHIFTPMRGLYIYIFFFSLICLHWLTCCLFYMQWKAQLYWLSVPRTKARSKRPQLTQIKIQFVPNALILLLFLFFNFFWKHILRLNFVLLFHFVSVVKYVYIYNERVYSCWVGTGLCAVRASKASLCRKLW